MLNGGWLLIGCAICPTDTGFVYPLFAVGTGHGCMRVFNPLFIGNGILLAVGVSTSATSLFEWAFLRLMSKTITRVTARSPSKPITPTTSNVLIGWFVGVVFVGVVFVEVPEVGVCPVLVSWDAGNVVDTMVGIEVGEANACVVAVGVTC